MDTILLVSLLSTNYNGWDDKILSFIYSPKENKCRIIFEDVDGQHIDEYSVNGNKIYFLDTIDIKKV